MDTRISLGPESIEVVAEAYEAAWRSLSPAQQTVVQSALLAQRILLAAADGVIDRDHLRARALEGLDDAVREQISEPAHARYQKPATFVPVEFQCPNTQRKFLVDMDSKALAQVWRGNTPLRCPCGEDHLFDVKAIVLAQEIGRPLRI